MKKKRKTNSYEVKVVLTYKCEGVLEAISKDLEQARDNPRYSAFSGYRPETGSYQAKFVKGEIVTDE